MNIMFLNNLNRKNKRLYKKFCTALNLSQSNQNHLKAFIHYLKDMNNNPDFEKENVERFERELSDIQAVNPTIIAFGNDAHRILNKHFKNKYKIYKVPHYSSNISKEQLREKFIEIQQKKQ